MMRAVSIAAQSSTNLVSCSSLCWFAFAAEEIISPVYLDAVLKLGAEIRVIDWIPRTKYTSQVHPSKAFICLQIPESFCLFADPWGERFVLGVFLKSLGVSEDGIYYTQRFVALVLLILCVTRSFLNNGLCVCVLSESST
jgi:hypothetical protein